MREYGLCVSFVLLELTTLWPQLPLSIFLFPSNNDRRDVEIKLHGFGGGSPSGWLRVRPACLQPARSSLKVSALISNYGLVSTHK